MASTDELTSTGLQTKDYNTLLSEIQSSIQSIYSPEGEEISFDSNTPDGQFTEILANIGTVIRELLATVYNATDPSKCDSTQQDTKYQLNYLYRKGGSWTIQPIEITTNKTVTLTGLDGSYSDEDASSYTVSDDSGNLWYLIDTTTLIQGTTTTCLFRAQNKGAVIPTIGTITNMVTIVDGVTSVSNNVNYTSLGVETESDYDFRIRREKSVANYSGNNAESMLGNILAIDGVDEAIIHVNNTNDTDTTGTLPHYIWAIVSGGANTEIADVIYSCLCGCGTRGSVTVTESTQGGQTLDINFDRPLTVGLYIKFNVKSLGTESVIPTDSIKTYISENLTYTIGEVAETSKITTTCANALSSNGGNGYALDIQISKGGTATADISTSTGITSASVVSGDFQDAVGDETETYDFMYDGTNWKLDTQIVELDDYGISYTGTPVDGDIIMIDYTAGTWSDYLSLNSIQEQFVTSTKKIYITVI